MFLNLSSQLPSNELINRFFFIFSNSGCAAFGYQVYSISTRFSKLVSQSALERENNVYIELNQSITEVEIQQLTSQLHSFEQTLETVVKGPKSFSKDSNPWHLLRILKSENISQDLYSQAVKALASSNYNGIHSSFINCFINLIIIKLKLSSSSAGLAQQVAQSCDFKTAIELARFPKVNLALFLQPPTFTTSSLKVFFKHKFTILF